MTLMSAWLDGSVQPVRVGWYQALVNSWSACGTTMRHWNGNNWERHEASNGKLVAVCPPKSWRGAAYPVIAKTNRDNP